jgi:hypothetical protein
VSDGAADPTGELRASFAALLETSRGSDPIAVGWATVELDRVEADFATSYPDAVTDSVALDDDDLLGAHVRWLRPGIAGLPALVLLEPSTEGRLAATLARNGEGPAAVWFASPRATAAGHVYPAADPIDPAAVRRSIPARGPFGTEVLLLDGPVHGPHRLVVLAETGTITP